MALSGGRRPPGYMLQRLCRTSLSQSATTFQIRMTSVLNSASAERTRELKENVESITADLKQASQVAGRSNVSENLACEESLDFE